MNRESHIGYRRVWAVLFILGNIAPTFSQGQQRPCTVTWDSIQQISFEACGSFFPHIKNVGDTIHVLWVNTPVYPAPDSAEGIFYSHSYDNGTVFSKPFRVAPDPGPNRIGAIDLGYMAASGRYLYWFYDSERFDIPPYDYWLAFRMSTDAGRSWSDNRIVGQYTSYNVAAIDSCVYFIEGYSDSINGHLQDVAQCEVSFNYTESFTTTGTDIPIEGGNNQLIVSQHALNYFYNWFVYGWEFEILHTRSTDNGLTWFPLDTLSSIDSIGSQHPAIASDGSGNIYLVWYDFKYGSIDTWHGSVLLRKSTDDGATWSHEQNLSYTPTAEDPRIAVYGNTVVVIWDEYIDLEHDRSMLRISYDGGKSWGDTTAVNNNAGDVDVAVNKDHIFTTWFTQQDTNIHIFYRRATFSGGCFPPIVPTQFALRQNYPNPFNGSTTISYDLPEPVKRAGLSIYNLLGQKITTLVEVNGETAGQYSVQWDAVNHSSGVYFYRLTTDKFTETKKLLLLK